MPPILDVAIGTVFVFLLFSIVVTALNEIVQSFSDKRADFLRLGLGEILADPQTEVVKGYLYKVYAFSVQRIEGAIAWVLGVPLALASIGAPAWLPIVSGIVLAVVVAVIMRANKASERKRANQEALANQPNQPVQAGEQPPLSIKVDALLQHPLIYSLSKGTTDPSYIGAGSFAQTIIDMLVPALNAEGHVGTITAPTGDQIKAAIDRLTNTNLKWSLAMLLKETEGDVPKFQAAVETWFDSCMVRVTGWYKRHAQTWLIVLALLLAVSCNVDSLRIIQTLSNNPNLAKAVAAQAETYAKANKAPQTAADLEATHKEKQNRIEAAQTDLEKAKKAVPADPGNVVRMQKALDEAEGWDASLATFRGDLKTLTDTGIPMGWDPKTRQHFNIYAASATAPTEDHWGQWNRPHLWNWSHLFTALSGWALTALAASLGAPFWFDLLQRFMNVRANVVRRKRNSSAAKSPIPHRLPTPPVTDLPVK